MCTKHTACYNLRSGVPIYFFRGGKERLIQLLDYSSAAPKLKYLSARMSAMPSLDIKNEPSTITGSRFVGGNYTRHEQFTCSTVQYGRQKYALFCKTRPPINVSFVMSKFQKQNLVKVPFHFVSQQKTRSSVAVFDVAVRPF